MGKGQGRAKESNFGYPQIEQDIKHDMNNLVKMYDNQAKAVVVWQELDL